MSSLLSIMHQDRRRERLIWQGVSTLAAVAGAMATRNLVKSGWRRIKKSEPPQNPLRQDVDWQDALLFGLITGAIAGVVRILMRRAAATGWNRWRGEWPLMD